MICAAAAARGRHPGIPSSGGGAQPSIVVGLVDRLADAFPGGARTHLDAIAAAADLHLGNFHFHAGWQYDIPGSTRIEDAKLADAGRARVGAERRIRRDARAYAANGERSDGENEGFHEISFAARSAARGFSTRPRMPGSIRRR